tara:strand:+ start:437 stop:1630 length:1194 start_codon:yes stop_codon:yes gene_type:complete
MSNTILTPSVITKEALAILHQKLNFIGNITTEYDDRYAKEGGKIGNDLKIRQPNEFTVRSGAALSAQDVTEQAVTMTVDTQKGVDINFSSEELTLHIDEFKDRYIEPAMSVLAATMESDALTMLKDVYNFHDGVGAGMSLSNANYGRKLLADSLAPTGMRSMLHNTQGVVDFVSDTKGNFNDQSAIAKQYREGALGRIAGFDHFENTLVPGHTTGTAVEGDTSYNINGASQSGAAITVDGGSTTFLKGDIISIAGVFRVHPETKVSTGVLQQFVITANSGTSATSLAISPALTATGGRQNVSAVPADNAAVNKVGGGANATWQETIAFQKGAFAFGSVDLIKPEGVHFCAREVMDGLSMRIIRDYTISDDKFPCRIDVMYGFKAIRPQLAARIGINS